MKTNFKIQRVRDKKYLLWQRDQPCFLTGQFANDAESIVPMHIGTAGKGIKSGDDETLPCLAMLHTHGHQHGEMSMIREKISDSVLRDALRAYAREQYREYKDNS